jgi:hypothetical protein
VVYVNDNEQAFQLQEASGVNLVFAPHYPLYNRRMEAPQDKDHPKIDQKKKSTRDPGQTGYVTSSHIL